MSSDHKSPKDIEVVKPFSVVVLENPKSGGVISKGLMPAHTALTNSEQGDVKVLSLAYYTGNDLQEDLRNVMSKAAKDQPVQILYLSNKAPNSLMRKDQAALFKRLDHNGKYPLKIATTASISLGELTEFEKQYGGIGLVSISPAVNMDVAVKRLLTYDAASMRYDDNKAEEKPPQPPRPLHEMFADAERLQHSVAEELKRIEQTKSIEPAEPSSAQKKQPQRRIRLKRRNPS